MSDYFLGETRIFSFPFAPKGWALCNGQLLSVAQNTALFSLLGTTYGGNGVQTFALPDLRGRAEIGQGSGAGLSPHSLGASAGEAAHTLTVGEMPVHSHTATGLSTAGDSADPTNRYPALAPTGLGNTYGPAGASVAMGVVLTGAGGSQPHNNMQPYLVLNFCIALQGIFPSRN